MIHKGTDHKIAFRNLNGANGRIKIRNIVGRHNPRAFSCQLTNTDRSCIAEVNQRRRIAHEECCRCIAVKFLRNKHIAQLFTVIERCIFKFIQCLRNGQRQKPLIRAERITAKAKHAKRNFKFRLICHFGKTVFRDDRMRMKLLDPFVEILAGLADFRRKQPLLGNRCITLIEICKERIARLHRALAAELIRPVDIDFDRTVKDCRQSRLERTRNCQRAEIAAAGQCCITNLPDAFRNPETDKRIAVGECILRDRLQRDRQTNLLILTGSRKRKRSDIADGIRQKQTRRSHASGKCIHVNELQAFRDNNMLDGFQAGKCAGCNPPDAFRQINGRECMLRFILTNVDILCEIRRERCIALRNLEYVIPDNELFRLLCSQDIIKLLHQIADGLNPGSGKNLLARPVQLDFRTEHEIFNCLALREIIRNIDICKSGTACECIRLDLSQCGRNLDRKQTGRIPECLCLDPADAFGDFKPFTALRIPEGAICNHGIGLQSSAALHRAGHRLGNILREDLFTQRIFTGMNRHKTDAVIKCSRYSRRCRSRLRNRYGRLNRDCLRCRNLLKVLLNRSCCRRLRLSSRLCRNLRRRCGCCRCIEHISSRSIGRGRRNHRRSRQFKRELRRLSCRFRRRLYVLNAGDCILQECRFIRGDEAVLVRHSGSYNRCRF